VSSLFGLPSGMTDTEVVLTVDRPEEGWKGNVGVVTTLLEILAQDKAGTYGLLALTGFILYPHVFFPLIK